MSCDILKGLNFKFVAISVGAVAFAYSMNVFSASAALKYNSHKKNIRRSRALTNKGVVKSHTRATSLTHSSTIMVGYGVPNVSLSSPNAFGSGSSIFAAIGYVNHWDGTKRRDGNFIAGASFGNPYKYVGVTLNWLADSTGFDDPFNKNGSFGFRINRYLARQTAVAFGMGSVAKWGALKNMSDSYYLALTQGFYVGDFPVVVNAGFGTGAFYSAGSMQAGSDKKIQFFGGLGVTVLPGLSLVMDYATEKLNAGATYIYSYHKVSLFMTAAAMNIAEHQNLGPHLQLNAGAAYQFS